MGNDYFSIKRNDLQPYYYGKALSVTGTAIDLTGATIRCTMYEADAGTLKINRQTTGVTITSAASGLFHYQWQSGDTDTTGTYLIEFEVTPQSGGKFTLPYDNKNYVVITGDLDAT